LFFASSLALAYFATQRPVEPGSVVDRAPAAQKKVEPATIEGKSTEAKGAEAKGDKPAPAEKSVPQ
jgi:hypothetical protein